MTDLLTLRDWQQTMQRKAAHFAGTPEADDYLCESKRYGMAADRIDELTAQLAIKNTKFDKLCKDYDEHDAELKRVIAAQRVALERIERGSNTRLQVRQIARDALK